MENEDIPITTPQIVIAEENVANIPNEIYLTIEVGRMVGVKIERGNEMLQEALGDSGEHNTPI